MVANLAGLIPAMLPFGTIFLTPLFGSIYDKYGKGATLMIIGSCLLTFVHVVFALPINSWVLAIVLMLILGIAFGLVPSAMWPSVPKIIPMKLLGTAYALIFYIQNIGLALIPVWIGKVNQANTGAGGVIDYTQTMTIFAAFGVIAIIISFLLLFEDKRKGSEDKETFHEPDGLKAYIKDLNNGKETVCDIVYFKKKQEDIEVEVAFQFVNEFEENILGFCNNIYTQEGGTHITGFKTKFTMIINQYARELGILKDKDANFTGLDVRNGMTAVVAVKHPAPRFEGQTKTKLDNPDAGTVVANVTGDEVQLYFDRHLDDLNAVIACAEKSAKIRKAEEKAKTNIDRKSACRERV